MAQQQFTFTEMFEAVAGAYPDRELHRLPRPAAHLRRASLERSRRLGPRPGRRRSRRPLRARRARRPRVRPGPRRPLPAQRQRVPGGDARRLQGPGRAVQRELPLRRRGAAVPAARRRRRGPSCTTPRFAPILAEVLDRAARRSTLLLQVADELRRARCSPGAVDYEDAPGRPPTRARSTSARRPTTSTSSTPAAPPACPRACSGASTTSSSRAMGGRPFGAAEALPDLEAIVAAGGGRRAVRHDVLPPLMHGAAQWSSFNMFTGGGTVVLPDDPTHLDAGRDLGLTVAARASTPCRSSAMPSPARSSRSSRPAPTTCRRSWPSCNGGARADPDAEGAVPRAAPVRLPPRRGRGLGDRRPDGPAPSVKGAATTGTFTPGPETVVVDAEITRVLEPGRRRRRLAGPAGPRPARLPGRRRQDGRAPSPCSTASATRCPATGPSGARTGSSSCSAATRSPSTPAARRSSPRRSRWRIAPHPSVADVVVTGRPSERWGQEVVAVVAAGRGGLGPTRTACSPRRRPTSPATSCPRPSCSSTRWCAPPPGKADYRWARAQADAASEG